MKFTTFFVLPTLSVLAMCGCGKPTVVRPTQAQLAIPPVVIESHPTTDEELLAADPMTGVIAGRLRPVSENPRRRADLVLHRGSVMIPATMKGDEFRFEGLPGGLYTLQLRKFSPLTVPLAPGEIVEDLQAVPIAPLEMRLSFKPERDGALLDRFARIKIESTVVPGRETRLDRLIEIQDNAPYVRTLKLGSELTLTVLTIRSGGVFRLRLPVTVDEEGLFKAEVQLEEWPFMTGTVVNEKGAPIPKADVLTLGFHDTMIMPSTGLDITNGTSWPWILRRLRKCALVSQTDGQGHFNINIPPNGLVHLAVHSGNHTPAVLKRVETGRSPLTVALASIPTSSTFAAFLPNEQRTEQEISRIRERRENETARLRQTRPTSSPTPKPLPIRYGTRSGELRVTDGGTLPKHARVYTSNASATVEPGGKFTLTTFPSRESDPQVSVSSLTVAAPGFAVDTDAGRTARSQRFQPDPSGQMSPDAMAATQPPVTVDLVRMALARGQIVSSTGAPVEHAQVLVRGGSGRVRDTIAVTDTEGRFCANIVPCTTQSAITRGSNPPIVTVTHPAYPVMIVGPVFAEPGMTYELEPFIIPEARTLALDIAYEEPEQAGRWDPRVGESYRYTLPESRNERGTHNRNDRHPVLTGNTIPLAGPHTNLEFFTKESQFNSILSLWFHYERRISPFLWYLGNVPDEPVRIPIPKLPLRRLRILNKKGGPVRNARIDIVYYTKRRGTFHLLERLFSPKASRSSYNRIADMSLTASYHGELEILALPRAPISVRVTPQAPLKITPGGNNTGGGRAVGGGFGSAQMGGPKHFFHLTPGDDVLELELTQAKAGKDCPAIPK